MAGGGEGGGGVIALHSLDLGAKRGWVVSTMPRPLYPGKDPVPIVQEAGWVPGPIWTCAGIRSPDHPARSQSLYQLSYPGQMLCEDEVYLPMTKYHRLNSSTDFRETLYSNYTYVQEDFKVT
jgi:hypothetical protein